LERESEVGEAMKCPKCQADHPEGARFCGNCGFSLRSPTPQPPAFQDSAPSHRPQASSPPFEIPNQNEISTQIIPTPVKELRRGAIFAKRYEIIEELGRGGMGRLYRVIDTKIAQEVALKILRPDISRDPKIIERFSNELKTARRIAHKNVCRMYHLGEEAGTYYIIMEYIPGQDLQSMIKMTKQLSVETVLSVAKQICDGLAEAHRLGVVHRDLKPGNIMIDRDGNAKILDFGIARSLESRGITEAGHLIGTPEYMSPEQAQDTGIDHRSDIYSLGVILYEMVTGQVPFTGDSPIGISLKHIEEPPEDLRHLAPQIPKTLGELILKCLEKNKEDRFQNARDLYKELDSIEKGIKDTKQVLKAKKTLFLQQMKRPFGTPKYFFPVLVLILAIALVFSLWKPWSGKEISPLASDKPSLAILYFKNNTGDHSLDHWRTALSDLLIADLSQSKYIRVLSSELMFDILTELDQQETQSYSSEAIREIARRGSVKNVLVGNYTRAGDRFRINVTIQDARSGELVGSQSVEGSGERSFYSMVDELTRKVKKDFQLPDEVIAADLDEQIGQITTSSPEALKYYTEGIKYGRLAEYGQAIVSFKEALRLDPEFAMAYEGIAGAYNNMGYFTEAREYFEKAFEFSDRVSERELYFIQGEYYRTTETTFDKAIEALNNLLRLYPEDGDGNNRLGLIYKTIEEWDKAIERYQVCIQNKYDRFFYYVNLAEVYMAKGMYERAGDILELYLDQFPDVAWIHSDYAINYLCQRQYEFARIEADKALDLDPTHYHALWIKGHIFLGQGNFTAAEVEYSRLLNQDEESARLYGRDSLGSMYLSQGRLDDAIAQITQGLQLADQLNDNPWKMWLSWRLAYLQMRAGNHQEALRTCSAALQTDIEGERLDLQRRVLYVKGLIEVAMNSLGDARRTAGELRRQIESGLNRKELRIYYHLAGTIEMARNHFQEAIDFFSKAISLLPHQYYRYPWLVGNDRGLFLDSLAQAYFRAKNFDEAQEEFGKIHPLTAGRFDYGDIFAKSYFMLGKIYEQRGWDQLARQNYQQFLDLWKNADPRFKELEDARTRLAAIR
jgi:serine/threonine protein kinase/Flp pilus assembly protein TadD